MSEDEQSCRIDVWLWRARFFKTRTLAARVVEEDGVRLSRGTARSTLEKASRQVRIGDVLAFAQGNRRVALRVLGLGERRGPASEARDLFFVIDVEGHSSGPLGRGESWSGAQTASPPLRKSGTNWPDPEGF